MGDFFELLFDSRRWKKEGVDAPLIVRAMIDLIRARKLVEGTPNVNRVLANKWIACERRVGGLFNALGEAAAGVPRCGAASCQRAWNPEGTALQACSRCRKVEYCSAVCQKASVACGPIVSSL